MPRTAQQQAAYIAAQTGQAPAPAAPAPAASSSAPRGAAAAPSIQGKARGRITYRIPQTGVPLQPACGDTRLFKQALVYGVKSKALGIPTANDNDTNVGTAASFMPNVIAALDSGNPILLESSTGDPFSLSDIWISGTADDGVEIEFIPL